MRQSPIHLRPSVARRIVSETPLCGHSPESPEYAEITTAEYVALFAPPRVPRGPICRDCADRFAADMRAHAASRPRPRR